MDEAAVLNSMSVEELVGICNRLQRSCSDMAMLLSEFQQEQEMLYREQDRLHHRIEKAAMKAERGAARQDGGIIWSLYAEVEQFFKEKEERNAAKRRRLSTRVKGPGDDGATSEPGSGDDEDMGPFSDANVKVSWGCDVSLGLVRQSNTEDIAALQKWVQEALCGESVAELEVPSDHRAAQMAAAAAAVQAGPRDAQFGDPVGRTLSSKVLGGSPAWDSDQERGVAATPPEANSLEALVSSALGLAGDRGPASGPGGESERRPNRDTRPVNPASVLATGLGILADFAGGGTQEQDLTMASQTVADPRRPSRDARPASVLATGLGILADLAGGVTQEQDMTMVSLTVVLKRTHESERWGLMWIQQGFIDKSERVVKDLKPGSVAAGWNTQQQAAGFPDRCITAMDRLISVNGRTGFEEMTAELSGREAVLEFQRAVPRDVQPPRAQAYAGERDGAASEGQESPATRKAKRETFAESLPSYLQTLRHVSAEPLDALVEVEEDALSDHGGAGGSAATELVPESTAASPTRPAGEGASPAGHGAGIDGGATPDGEPERPPEPSLVPHRVVAQVLSFTAGSVRLSWLFDWAVAPLDLVGAEGVVHRFCITQRRDSDAEEQLLQCERPAISLQLVLGHRYSFHVRALLLDSRASAPSSSEAALLEGAREAALWTSAASAVVVADLRGAAGMLPRSPAAAPEPVRSPLGAAGVAGPVPGPGREVEAVAAGAASAAASAPVRAPKRPTVAASLGSFLAQRPQPSAGGEAPRSSPKNTASHAAQPFSPKAAAADAAKDQEGGPGLQPASPALASGAAAASPASPTNPLGCARPRVVYAGPLDAAAEKRAMSDRLLLRRGQPLVPREEATLQEKLRMLSTDSDDEEDSLMKLSSALVNLERTAASRNQKPAGGAETSVAEEGHHGLQGRIEPMLSPAWRTGGGERLGGAIVASAAAPSNGPQGSVDGPAPPERRFRLTVQTHGKSPVLEFGPGDDLPTLVAGFIKQHSLRDLLTQPLVSRARLLIKSDRQEDALDIIDLL